MKTKLLSTLIAGLLIGLSIGSVSGSNRSEQTLGPALQAAETYLEAQIGRHRIKGMAVAITQGQEIIYVNGFGSAGGSRPVTSTTPFFIGSVSKSFTALAVMQLVDQGVIDLDAPVQTYLPWFTTSDNASASRITIRHLLNQTSGLSNASLRRPNITEETTLEETVRHLNQATLTAPPGTSFSYFNPNYNVLGQVIEEVTGTDFATYLVNNVFEPLAMKHSFVDLESAQKAGVAEGHIYFLGFPMGRQQKFYPAELPAGFVISSAEDMAHYMIAQLNDGTFQQTQILSADAVEAMQTPPLGVPGDYAMGWAVHEKDGIKIVQHNGAVETFFAEVVLLPDQDIGITLLINQNALIPLLFAYEPLVGGLVDALLGLQPARGVSMRLVYSILTMIIIYDLIRHGLSLKQMPKWWQKVQDKTKPRIIFGVILSDLLIPAVLVFVVVMMIINAGINAARITLLYYMFDIALWLSISVILSVIEAVLKFRWMAKHKTSAQSTA